jgi:hypothetical protein
MKGNISYTSFIEIRRSVHFLHFKSIFLAPRGCICTSLCIPYPLRHLIPRLNKNWTVQWQPNEKEESKRLVELRLYSL